MDCYERMTQRQVAGYRFMGTRERSGEYRTPRPIVETQIPVQFGAAARHLSEGATYEEYEESCEQAGLPAFTRATYEEWTAECEKQEREY